MRHGDRPHNYVSNYIFGFAISSGLTNILPIEKCIIFFETPCTTRKYNRANETAAVDKTRITETVAWQESIRQMQDKEVEFYEEKQQEN